MRKVSGIDKNHILEVQIYPEKSNSLNIAFDVTPSKFISGIICEYGIFEASTKGIKEVFARLSE